jgi:hypothetical protein
MGPRTAAALRVPSVPLSLWKGWAGGLGWSSTVLFKDYHAMQAAVARVFICVFLYFCGFNSLDIAIVDYLGPLALPRLIKTGTDFERSAILP